MGKLGPSTHSVEYWGSCVFLPEPPFFLSSALCFLASPGRAAWRLWWLSLGGFAITAPDMDDLSREWDEDPEVGRAQQRSSVHRTLARKLSSGLLIFSGCPFISFRPQA